ncbi:MAG TPA: hypothetical protein VGM76_12015 [Lacipirellulaceae bacterium]|jgi:hypothetical protein
MARDESEREDLLHEATALVERIELSAAGAVPNDHLFAGFRKDGSLSVYFGSDPVYHFNSAGELRRAFCDGLVIKADRGRLVSLDRRRQDSEVQLVRHDLTDEEQVAFLASMTARLNDFESQCCAGTLSKVGQIPADADVLSRVLAFLTDHREAKIADEPNAR